MSAGWTPSLGATYLGDGRCRFRVWAPFAQQVQVRLLGPPDRCVPLEPAPPWGYYQAVIDGAAPGSLYFYRLDEAKERPDPASRSQPQGVHGPSQVIDPGFPWEDHGWAGLPLQRYIIYELHVGAFTPEGTFDAVITHLEELQDLGVTAIELMPVAQFPGRRNWGYDGVDLFAVQDSYGGPDGLRRLVNACHKRGLALILDVVYNHLGPEGNYLGDFGPYFTEKYRTPWGAALNFDGPQSDEVKRFFIENALCWTTEFHIDALRLDAVHAILDNSPRPFLEDLADAVHQQAERLNRRVYLMPESSANNVRLLLPGELGGYGMDAQWNDDFHHALHTLLTPDRTGYYQDYGRLQDLARAFAEGYVYSGQYSGYRQRSHGTSSREVPASKFVVFSQNHDQVGNRALSDRLSQMVSFEALKLAAGVVLLSPFIPLLFMGEEYGETAPFHYFIEHSEPNLVETVRRGRREEFTAFAWQGESPDPQAEVTFLHSKLDYARRHQERHGLLLEFYRELIWLRKELPALAHLSKKEMEVLGYEKEQVLFLRRWHGSDQVCVALTIGDAAVAPDLPIAQGRWRKAIDSAEVRWDGGGSAIPDALSSEGQARLSLNPKTFILLERTEQL